jgi:pyruvate dehydrogenase E1 component beta subunit
MVVMNLIQAINDALKVEMEKDKDVILLGEDIGVDGGVFRATDKLIDLYGADRVADTPLSESGIIGSSVGLAMYGLKPVCEIQFSGFIYSGMEQLVSHAARVRNRSRGSLKCQMVLRAPYSGGIHAPEHHSESMEAFYGHAQGLKVVIPYSPYDAKGLLISAIRDPDPVIFLEPKKIYRAVKQEVPEGEYTVPIGKANVMQEGDDLTVISWGAMMKNTYGVVSQIKDKSIELIDLRTISPLDMETVIDSVEKTGKCLIVQEAPRSFGPASEIIAQLNEKSLTSLEAPVARLTGFDVPFPLHKLENYYLPNGKRIANAINKLHAE